MQDLSLIAGEWAVGYHYMYVMLRVLLNKKPSSVLEMGLGQSSKILARYQNYSKCHYDIVEQDETWYQFFCSELDLSDQVSVHIRPIEQRYNEKYGVYVNSYVNFNTVIDAHKYELISIDGPWGSEKISRVDILPYIPKCLEESFCILIDDYECDGEQNMICELESVLQHNQIEYYKAVYEGDKKFCLITSKDNSFLCTL